MSFAFALIVILILAILGMPVFAVLTAIAMLGFYFAEVDLAVMAIELYRLTDTSILLALPLFTFAGYVLSESNTSHRLVRLTQALIGSVHGGLAFVALIACALFTALTGASGVTIVALGALLYPALKEGGYSDKFSLGLVTSSGSLGLLLPPSLPLILYSIIASQMDLGVDVSLETLFIAGLLPAALMLVLLCGYSWWSHRNVETRKTPFSWREVGAACWEAKWELPLPLVILGSVYSGLVAVSEAAALTAAYVLIIEVFVYREVSVKALPRIIRESMVMVGSILLILGVAMAFTNYLIDIEVPSRLFDWMQRHVDDRLTFLLLLNIFLLLLGAMLDIFAALIVVVPLLLPVAIGYGIDPVHLGIIFLANMQIGYFTPPVGMNLFIASYRFQKPVLTLYQSTIPFFWVLLAAVLIITYVPELSLMLLDRGL
ncbi:TRAP transporter large permease [Permianibacter aggregans]|uniref:TRAP transporter large permease protein n=1 Tax=Permianibacter aggregans TaxID=1510150 RepID=A0A4R6UKL6_9GAMM|nr:TRAP transporter large permease subunit [Permianibacter aggregans]QGX40271.1 TRAP transporter large permease subunit [Permianibacter aggregans]TDQ47530.1 tripartite ATP-independent transporter DctM subunit [Permianibacter aggregans]